MSSFNSVYKRHLTLLCRESMVSFQIQFLHQLYFPAPATYFFQWLKNRLVYCSCHVKALNRMFGTLINTLFPLMLWLMFLFGSNKTFYHCIVISPGLHIFTKTREREKQELPMVSFCQTGSSPFQQRQTIVLPADTSNSAESSGDLICKTRGRVLAYGTSRLLEGFQVMTLLPLTKGRYVYFAVMSGALLMVHSSTDGTVALWSLV